MAAVFVAVTAMFFGATEIFIRLAVEPYDHFSIHVRQFNESRSTDVVFGDSRMAHAFVDGHGFLDLSRSGEPASLFVWKAQNYFASRKAGRVIVQADPEMLSRDRQRPADFLEYVDAPPLAIMKRRHRSHLLAYWYNFTLARARFANVGWFNNPGFVGLADFGRDERRRLGASAAESWRPLARERIDGSVTGAAFREMVRSLRDAGAELCLVGTPLPSEFRQFAEDEPAFSAAAEWLKDLALEFDARLVSYRSMFDDPAYFRDIMHLNGRGSRIFFPRMVEACFGSRQRQ